MTTIAVIEDNPDNRLLLSAMLQGKYDPIEYSNGQQALRGMLSQPPDLILLDISLPERDGLHVLRNVRNEPSLEFLPVVALTAHAMEGDREKYLSLGFNGYLSKPIVKEKDLFNIIDTLLDSQ